MTAAQAEGTRVAQIHPEICDIYDRTFARARTAAAMDPELQTMRSLLARRRQLRGERTDRMDPRERAWHDGELAGVSERIAAWDVRDGTGEAPAEERS